MSDTLTFNPGALAILTNSGEVWVGGEYNPSIYGDGSTSTNSNWHQVETAPGVNLTGVTELELAPDAGFAVTSTGVYTWGQAAYLGGGNSPQDLTRANLI